jgi:hypothetical protein
VAQEDAQGVADAAGQLAARRQPVALPAPVLDDRSRDAVYEHERRQDGEHVPQDLQRRLEVPEDVARLHLELLG